MPTFFETRNKCTEITQHSCACVKLGKGILYVNPLPQRIEKEHSSSVVGLIYIGKFTHSVVYGKIWVKIWQEKQG